MAGINKIILVGNLGKDPETSYTPSGTCICKFSIATSEKWKNKDNPDASVEKIQWHRITTFGKLAEICEKYLVKGKQVYIEGKLQYGSYEKDGITHYTTDIIASQMQMLGNRDDGTKQAQPKKYPSHRSEDQDDDIPF